MAYVLNAPLATVNPVARITKLIAVLAEKRAKHQIYARTVRELEALTDRELADIGISRLDINAVAHSAVK